MWEQSEREYRLFNAQNYNRAKRNEFTKADKVWLAIGVTLLLVGILIA